MVKFNFVCLLRGGGRRRQLVGDLKEMKMYWKSMRKQNTTLCGELALEEAMDLCYDKLWKM